MLCCDHESRDDRAIADVVLEDVVAPSRVLCDDSLREHDGRSHPRAPRRELCW